MHDLEAWMQQSAASDQRLREGQGAGAPASDATAQRASATASGSSVGAERASMAQARASVAAAQRGNATASASEVGAERAIFIIIVIIIIIIVNIIVIIIIIIVIIIIINIIIIVIIISPPLGMGGSGGALPRSRSCPLPSGLKAGPVWLFSVPPPPLLLLFAPSRRSCGGLPSPLFAMALLTPLRAGDRYDAGRFAGRGRKRFYREIGGACLCPCTRPGDAHWLEAEDEQTDPATYYADRLRNEGLIACACMQCGAWEQGPLRPGESRRFFGCVHWILVESVSRTCDACQECPPVSGVRTLRAGG